MISLLRMAEVFVRAEQLALKEEQKREDFGKRKRSVKYDYERIVQGILDIGEAMIRCGAENFRLQDSLYRICRSYGFVKYDIFVIPSNIPDYGRDTGRADYYTDSAGRNRGM